MQCLRNSDDHDHEHRFEPTSRRLLLCKTQPHGKCVGERLHSYKVIGVPDSYVVEVDGRWYHRNKCDLTLSPLENDDECDNHPDDHDVPIATEVMPTLCP